MRNQRLLPEGLAIIDSAPARPSEFVVAHKHLVKRYSWIHYIEVFEKGREINKKKSD